MAPLKRLLPTPQTAPPKRLPLNGSPQTAPRILRRRFFLFLRLPHNRLRGGCLGGGGLKGVGEPFDRSRLGGAV